MTAWKAGHLGVLRGNPRRDRRRGKLVPIDVKPKAATEGGFGKYSGTKIKIVGLDAPEAPSSQTMVGQGCQEVTHGHWVDCRIRAAEFLVQARRD